MEGLNSLFIAVGSGLYTEDCLHIADTLARRRILDHPQDSAMSRLNYSVEAAPASQ